jgi:hypothetical protein
MVHNLARRIGRIEKEIGKDTVWLCVPRKWLGLDGNPEELVEIKGCRTLADVMVLARKARTEGGYRNE